MKKLFNHTKRPYRQWKETAQDGYDWDEVDGEYYAESEEIYEEDEYYAEAEEDYDGDGEYYAEAEEDYDGDGEYYAEPEEIYDGDGEYYAEAEEDYDGDGEYYAEAEEDYDGDGEYYTEPEEDYDGEQEVFYYEEYEEEEAPRSVRTRRSPRKKSTGIAQLLCHMGTMDWMMAATGVGVLLLAIITGSVYASSRMTDKQMDDFVSVGSQLAGIDMIGEQGLLAVADAQMAKLAAANAVEEELSEEQKEYQEEEYSTGASVELEMISVQKDLKIKFINKKTSKLIANVPFTVTITDPDGKTATWSDDDCDGIIYKKGLTPGSYRVSVNALADEKYSDYTLPSSEKTVEVKKDIAYKKIDVTNEIKKESEINVAKEDTAKNNTVVESTLQDTVQWVESTVTSDTYVEVPKATVPDPATIAASGRFLRMAANINSTNIDLSAGNTHALTVTDSAGTGKISGLTWSSDDSSVATVSQSGVVTAVGAGNTTIRYTASYTVSGGNAQTISGACTVRVGAMSVTLDKTAATVYLGTPVNIQATVSGAGTISAESSDTAVATVAVSDKTITVTGVKAGSATIKVKYTENGASVETSCVVTVKVHPKDDRTTLLKDSSGQQLYVLENDRYREAVYADYYTATQFFVKGNAKYTGWQTLDGKVYYFNASGEKVTGEQVIQGAKYNFASDGTLITGSGTLGIDVSKWNGSIDWNAVKNSGVSYVIIRVGYRGSSQGALIDDPKFQKNIQGATAAGLKVGVYFFTQAVDEVEAVEEASMVLERISGYRISYPVFLDVEPSGGRGDKIDKATRTAVCKAFCNTIQDAGYTAGIYANKTWLTSKLDAGSLGGYKIWLAQYAATPTYSGHYDLWQYKSTGKVSGISGNVDLNLSYLGY